MNSTETTPFIVGITGASGAIYAKRLIGFLKELGQTVHGVATEAGRKVLTYEDATDVPDLCDKFYAPQDLFAPIASGTFRHRGMIIVPCSMGTLGKMAHGIGDNLLTRAADVTLKEKRKLIVIPRETPMHALHFRNQETLCNLGAIVLPANPAFYLKPQTIEDLVDTVLARVLDHLGLEHAVSRRWREMGH